MRTQMSFVALLWCGVGVTQPLLAQQKPGPVTDQASAVAGQPGGSSTASTTAAGAPGLIRIGIPLPLYAGTPTRGAAAGETVRSLEQQLLVGPNLEVVKLTATLPPQALAEAKTLNCDYVLNSSVTQKKASGFGGIKGLGSLAQMSPMMGGLGITKTASVLQTAIVAAHVADVAADVRAKSEVSFEYELVKASGESVIKDSEHAKAKADGEDVITPMVQQAMAKATAAAKR